MSDDSVARLAKFMVVVITGVAMYFAIYSSSTLVGLLLFAYSGIAQFFPGIVLGLFWKRVTMPGVFAGLIIGLATAMILILTKHDPLAGLNAGFIALCLNAVVTVGVSLATAPQPNYFEEQIKSMAAAEVIP
jgi:SSS family solute:Na+ symporter